MKLKVSVDIAMTIVLILLMSYALIGETSHEILGISMFVLFVVHHILNHAWTKNLFRGRYTSARIVQTVVIVFILLCMLCQMFSGIVLSKHIFVFMRIPISLMFVRTLHMLGAYWGFVLMSVHLGFHWNRMMRMMKKAIGPDKTMASTIMQVIGWGIIAYGIFAFFKREIPLYMFVIKPFVFFDFHEKIGFFFMDYIAVMGAFVGVGYYIMQFWKGAENGREEENK